MKKRFMKTYALFAIVAMLLISMPVTATGPDFRGRTDRINFRYSLVDSAFSFLPLVTRINLICALGQAGIFRTFGSLDSLRVADGD